MKDKFSKYFEARQYKLCVIAAMQVNSRFTKMLDWETYRIEMLAKIGESVLSAARLGDETKATDDDLYQSAAEFLATVLHLVDVHSAYNSESEQ